MAKVSKVRVGATTYDVNDAEKITATDISSGTIPVVPIVGGGTGASTASAAMGNLNVYSTSEQRVGTWIDGKPLYRRVFTGTASMPSDRYTTLFRICNLSTVVKVEGLMSLANGQWTSINSSYGQVQIYVNQDFLLVVADGQQSRNIDYRVIVEYTLTTD